MRAETPPAARVHDSWGRITHSGGEYDWRSRRLAPAPVQGSKEMQAANINKTRANIPLYAGYVKEAAGCLLLKTNGPLEIQEARRHHPSFSQWPLRVEG